MLFNEKSALAASFRRQSRYHVLALSVSLYWGSDAGRRYILDLGSL